MPTANTGDVYHAIADSHRRAILELLSRDERPVNALVDEFDVSFAAISQHLRVLRHAGLVARRPDGRTRIYRATPAGLHEIYDWTAQYRDFWRGRLARLNTYLDDQR